MISISAMFRFWTDTVHGSSAASEFAGPKRRAFFQDSPCTSSFGQTVICCFAGLIGKSCAEPQVLLVSVGSPGVPALLRANVTVDLVVRVLRCLSDGIVCRMAGFGAQAKKRTGKQERE